MFVLSLHAEEYDTGLFQSALPPLSSRVLQVMGELMQVCFIAGFEKVCEVKNGVQHCQ